MGSKDIDEFRNQITLECIQLSLLTELHPAVEFILRPDNAVKWVENGGHIDCVRHAHVMEYMPMIC